MDLCVIVLTVDLDTIHKPPKYLPKICYKVGEKSMIEICLENVSALNPSSIILMVSKYNIIQINSIIKYAPYAKYISYCLIDNGKNKKQKISLAQDCYSSKNILAVPANSPYLTTKSLQKILYENRNLKISKSLFFLKKNNLEIIDSISNFPSEDFLSGKEIKQIESQADLDEANNFFAKRKK